MVNYQFQINKSNGHLIILFKYYYFNHFQVILKLQESMPVKHL